MYSLSKQFTTSDVLINTPMCVQTDEGDTEQERRLIYTGKERDVGDYMAGLCPSSPS